MFPTATALLTLTVGAWGFDARYSINLLAVGREAGINSSNGASSSGVSIAKDMWPVEMFESCCCASVMRFFILIPIVESAGNPINHRYHALQLVRFINVYFSQRKSSKRPPVQPVGRFFSSILCTPSDD